MQTTPRLSFIAAVLISWLAATTTLAADAPKMEMTTNIPSEITTPDSVDTSIGTLPYLDGAPYPETAEKAYDLLDTMRGVDALLKGMPGASVQGLIHGKGWFVALRIYGPLEPWIEKTWRPGEIELVK